MISVFRRVPIAVLAFGFVFISSITFASDFGRITPIITSLLLSDDDRETLELQNDALTLELGLIDNTLNVLSNDTDARETDVINFGGPNQANVVNLKPGGTVLASSGALITLARDGQLTYDGTGIQPLTSGTDTIFYQALVQSRAQTAQVNITYGELPSAVDNVFTDVSGADGLQTSQTPAPNIISDDVLGVPEATIVSFGGGDLSGSVSDNLAGSTVSFAGGALTVNADGSITLLPDSEVGVLNTGTFNFNYRIQNTIGSADADVEVSIVNAPVAQDDVFTFLFNQNQNSPNSLFNDNGNTADFLGSPAATIISFGGGSLGGTVIDTAAGNSVTLAGGTLTVNANGSWSLIGESFTGGEFTFDYRIENTSGVSDGTVTLNIQVPPRANDDTVASLSIPSDDFHGIFNTVKLAANGDSDDLDQNDTLGSPAATINAFGAVRLNDGAGTLGAVNGTVSDNPAGTPVSFASLNITDITDGSLLVNTDGSYTLVPPTGYTGLISFQYRLSNTAGSDTATVTLAVGARSQCTNDTSFTSSVNVPVSGNVLTNDSGDAVSVTAVQGVAANVGIRVTGNATAPNSSTNLLTLNSNGSFTHSPASGFVGANGFSYAMTNGFGSSGPCSVTITTSEVDGQSAWFINSSVAGSGNVGTFSDPFTSIAAFNTVNTGGAGQPESSDVVYIDRSGTYAEANGVNLLANQVLLGGGTQLSASYSASAGGGASLISDYSTLANQVSGANSIVSATSGNGVNLATNNILRGFTVTDTPNGFGINGDTIGNLTVQGVEISGTGGAFRFITLGNVDNVSFDAISSTSSVAENILLDNIGGTMTINEGIGLAGSAVGSAAVRVVGSSAGFSYPGAVSKNNAGSLLIVSNSNTGTLTFNGLATANTSTSTAVSYDSVGAVNFSGGLNIDTTSGTGLSVNGGRVNIAATNGDESINSTNGIAVDVNNSQLNVALDAVSSGSGAIHGLEFDQTTGAFSVSGPTSVLNAGASGIDIDTSSATFNFNGLVNIGGPSFFATGINIPSTSGSTTNFNGGVTVSTVSGTAIQAAGTDTLNILNVGTETLVTNAGRGLNLGAVTANINLDSVTVVNTTADGVNLSGTRGSLTFGSISVDNAENGIVLANMGVGSQFTVTGDGTTDVQGGNGSGGTIQNTRGPAVLLTSANNVSLQNMNIIDAGDDGIRGTNLTDLTLINSSIMRNGDALGEQGIDIMDLVGSNSRIANSVISQNAEFNVSVLNANSSALPNQLSVTSSVLSNTAANTTFGADCLFYGGVNGANMQLTVEDSSFTDCRTDGIQVDAANTATVSAFIRRNQIEDTDTGINLSGSNDASLSFEIDGNTVLRSLANMINITHGVGSGDATGSVVNNILNGPNGNVGTGSGIRIVMEGQGVAGPTGVVLIDNNTVRRFNNPHGIHALARAGAASLDATITNNLVETPGPFAADGIRVEAGNGTASESNSVCLNMTGNDSTTLAFDEGYELQQYAGTSFELQGLDTSDCSGSVCDGTNANRVEEFVLDNNTGGNGPGNSGTANVRTAGRIVNYTAGTCSTVPAP